MLVEKNDEISRLKQKFSGEEKKSEDESTGEEKAKIDNTSRAYIKNVLLKFLEYQAEQMEREALMMEKVLFTVLKMRPEEVERLQAKRLEAYNSGLMSYIWAADESNMVGKPMSTTGQR